MKKLLYVVAFCAFGVNASDFDLPRGISSERDIEELKTCYFKGWPHVPRNVDALKQRAIQKVAGDHQAEKAMELFSDCKYLHLVDYCEDHLSDMTDENAQLFREALVLLAPWLSIGN
ncbi:MAG: hypothetical protein LBE97_01135, partial [Holosporales bacterium]|nr:hypothetical protein [Holosporales bacterium]